MLHELPTAQQVCAYLFYYVDPEPEPIADILHTMPDMVCGTLQQVRQTVLPQIESVLKSSAAFRGADTESAILWALRCTQNYVPSPGETDQYYQSLLEKLIHDEVLDVSAPEEEAEPQLEIPMREIAPPKEHRLLHAIFSLRTLIIVLSVLIVAGLVVGLRQLHRYNQRRMQLNSHPDRTTLSLTATQFPSEHYIFSTEFEAPTEPEATTEEPPTTEVPATTETTTVPAPTETERTEPTTPVITTTKPHSEFERTVSGNTVTITGYTGSAGSVTVPDKIDGMSVTAIGDNAFYNSSVSSVKLPDSIRSIGKNAFRNCSSLQSIVLPSGVTTIGSDAFHSCTALRTVALPSSLQQLGAQAFYGCYALTGINLPSSLSSMGSSVFYDCKSLNRCTVEPNSHLNALGEATFFNCTSLDAFTIPSSVSAIPSNCFAGCRSLESITIPSSVTTIGQNAFLDCSGLSAVKFGSGLRKIDTAAFSGCRSLSDLTLPHGLNTVGVSAFSNCTGLRYIEIPDSVSNIGSKAFEGCKDLVIDCPEGSYAEKYATNNQIELANKKDDTYNSDTSSE